MKIKNAAAQNLEAPSTPCLRDARPCLVLSISMLWTHSLYVPCMTVRSSSSPSPDKTDGMRGLHRSPASCTATQQYSTRIYAPVRPLFRALRRGATSFPVLIWPRWYDHAAKNANAALSCRPSSSPQKGAAWRDSVQPLGRGQGTFPPAAAGGVGRPHPHMPPAPACTQARGAGRWQGHGIWLCLCNPLSVLIRAV